MPKNFMKGDGKNTKIVEIPDDILLPGNLNAIDQGRKVINVRGNNAQPGVANYAVSLNAVINKSIEEGRIDVTPDLGDTVVTTSDTQTISGTKTFSAVVTANAGIAGGASADITLNTNKFTVDATQGNTLVAGTLTVQGDTITASSVATLKLAALPTYADNAAATGGGLVTGDVYQTATGELRIVTV